MSKQTEHDRDTRPWYKQFWPWFVMALPATAVAASLVSVTLAVNNAPVITDDSIGRFARPDASTSE